MSNETKKTALPKLRFPEFERAPEWVKKTIGQLARVTTGGTPDSSKKEYWGGNIPWMNSGELNQKRVWNVANRITALGLKESSTKPIPPHCILIGLAGQGKTRGTAAINYIEVCTNQSIAAIHPNNKAFDSEFLYQRVDIMYDELRSLSTGEGGRGGLNLQIIKSIEIPFPPIEEQQKIAATLSSLDDLITAQNAKLAALQAHKRGLMQGLFPAEGETVPKLRFLEFQGAKEWQKKKLGELVEMKGRIGYRGYTVADIVEQGKGAISLSPGNITNEGRLTFAKSTFISWKKYDESPEIMLSEGFTVLVKTGYSFGKAALIKDLSEKSTINPQLVVLKPIHINSIFLHLLVINSAVQKQINDRISGGDIPSMSQETISKFDVLIPAEDEQQKIADCLSSLDSRITAQSQKIEALKLHKKGLMQNLFPAAAEPTA